MQYKLNIHGQLLLETHLGEDVTPRSAKMQAILGMLAIAPDLERSRVWLQNRLWSDRATSQAAASLRQDLSEFRKAIGDLPPLLEVTRKTLRLVPGSVDIVAKMETGREYLEGIRVRDNAFREWLLNERARRATVDPNPEHEKNEEFAASPFLVIRPSSQVGIERFLASEVLDSVAHGLAEQTSLEIKFDDNTQTSTLFSLTAESFTFEQQAGIQMRLDDVRRNRSVWSRTGHIEAKHALQSVSLFGADASIGLLVNEVSERLVQECLDKWRRGHFALDATVACQIGIGKVFTFDMAEQDEADELFALAFSKEPRGLYLAWRVMLRVIRIIEMHQKDVQKTLEEVDEFSAQALELEPANSMVLAAASNAAMLVQEDMLAARELAARALKVSPTNPFAWDCNSIWHLLAHEFEKAHMMQLRARSIAADPRSKHWWDMGCALTATVTGRFDEAREFAERASALVPNFRPPLRYLTALYANEDRISEAQVAADKLMLIEPDFSLERMVSDPRYPAAALKRSSLANRDLVRRFGW